MLVTARKAWRWGSALARQLTHDPKASVGVAVRRTAWGSYRRTAHRSRLLPAAPTQHAFGTDAFRAPGVIDGLRGVNAWPVQTPLGDVAVHVVEPPGIRWIRAHLDGLADERAWLRPAEGFGPVEVGLPR